MLGYQVRRLFVNVCKTLGHQEFGPFVKLFKIVRGMGDSVWGKSKPFNIFANSVSVGLVLCGWIGVVKSKKATPVVF